MENLTNKAVFVLHVKKGYEDREQHIKAMLQKMNIPFRGFSMEILPI